MTRRRLGTCWYPEHVPEARWAEDARLMKGLGLAEVRIGEFAWSRIEPARGALALDWLARAVDVLAAEGLDVILGTPTAAPPKWLVDEMPDMLPVDAAGRVRRAGSRRHVCMSHPGYRAECARIVTALAERLGTHPAVTAWQIDNEYDCHGTAISYSPAALAAFRAWLRRRYGDIALLNEAWGTVFWSAEYGSFEEVDFPEGGPAECSPAHRLDFRRFVSDEVVAFNRVQAAILRRLSPGRALLHNFMGRSLAFDHFALGADLDISAWDSYPVSFLEDRADRHDEHRLRFARAGDPDFQAFHHDLYRATSRGRFQVMEQAAGPVNWAPHNPVPRPGMTRLWAWEAFAHGAEAVSFFPWRQAPFGQEQMHAGLLRPDSVPAEGFHEVAHLARELAAIDLPPPGEAPVGLVFDYESCWAWEIERQGAEFDGFRLVLGLYRLLRRLGLDVDILPTGTEDFGDRRLVLVPALFAWTDALRVALANARGPVLVGPRSGAKTESFAIPPGLPPDLAPDLLDLRVIRVETLRADMPVPVPGGVFRFWREFAEAGPRAEVRRRTADGWPALVAQGALRYVAGWPDEPLWLDLLRELAAEAGLPVLDLPDGLRLRRSGPFTVAVNYGPEPVDLGACGVPGLPVLGARRLAAAGVAVLATG